MLNDSTGQFKGRKYLEAGSSLSMAQFEGTGLAQHHSFSVPAPTSANPGTLQAQGP